MKVKEDIKELSEKDIKELSKELNKSRQKLTELRSNIVLGKLKNFREIRLTRKRIARIMTILSNKAAALIEETAAQGDAKELSHV